MLEQFLKRESDDTLPLDLDRKKFLEDEYLASPYVVEEEADEVLKGLSMELLHKYPDVFMFITVVGGVANGSFALRKRENPQTTADLDFLIGGMGASEEDLLAISGEVKNNIKKLGLIPDSIFGGKNIEDYLNLNDIPGHIERGDFNLLALPFQASYGKPYHAKTKVLRAVIEHPDSEQVWANIKEYYRQSLSMHHGTWSNSFNNEIFHKYYPQKIKKFSLANTPQEELAKLES